MSIKRFRYDVHGELSAGPGAVLTTNAANKTIFLENPGADKIAFYDQSAGVLAWLGLGAGLSFNGTTLETSAGSGFISAVQEEGVDIGAGVTTLNFIGSGYTAAKVGAVANITLDADLNALSQLGSIGYAVRTAADTWAQRTLTGTAGRLSVTNGDGTSGNPVFNIDTNVAFKNANETITGSWTFNNAVLAATVPTLGDHLVNKTYVDGLLAGVRRTSVRAATTVAGTLATSFENGDTIDTVVLATNDRLLIKNQAAPAENGVYIVQATGAPVRALDMDAAAEVDGTLVIVEDGSQQGQQWYTVSEVVTLNTDPITFTKIQVGVIDGSGAANQVAYWSDSDTLTGNANWLFDATTSPQLVIGDTAVTSLTVLTTKGTTTNNSAWGYTHKNSSNTQVFRVSNDGTTQIGSANQTTLNTNSVVNSDGTLFSITASAAPLTMTSTGIVSIRGGGAAFNAASVALDPTRTSITFDQWNLQVNGTFTAAGVGTNQYQDILLAPTINQTGGHTGVTYALKVNPTLTAAADFRGIDITAAGQTALWIHSGKLRVDFGSDATGDIPYRDSTGKLARLAIGTSSQVLIGGTIPAWGSAPVTPTEAFVTGVTGTTVDLDSLDGKTKDRDGTNLAFTIPTVGQKMSVYRGGMKLDSDGAGGSPSRDYSVNTTTHVITFNEALSATETVYIVKYA